MAVEVQKVLVAELARHGVVRYQVVRGGKHVKLHFDWQGVPQKVVFPVSASDRRSGLNARAYLRRLLRERRHAAAGVLKNDT